MIFSRKMEADFENNCHLSLIIALPFGDYITGRIWKKTRFFY